MIWAAKNSDVLSRNDEAYPPLAKFAVLSLGTVRSNTYHNLSDQRAIPLQALFAGRFDCPPCNTVPLHLLIRRPTFLLRYAARGSQSPYSDLSLFSKRILSPDAGDMSEAKPRGENALGSLVWSVPSLCSTFGRAHFRYSPLSDPISNQSDLPLASSNTFSTKSSRLADPLL